MINTFAAMLAAPSILFVFAIWGIGGFFGRKGEVRRECRPWLFGGAMFLMLLVRVLSAGLFKGYVTDVQTFQAWAIQAARDFSGFYSGAFFADYPPGYIYILFLIGKIRDLLFLGEGSRSFLVLTKMPAMVADLATVLLLYRFAKDNWGNRCGVIFALLYGFNPAIILNSAIWGQVDSVFTFFILSTVICLARDWVIRGAVFFAIGLLVKPQALIFTPIIIGFMLRRLFFERSGGIRRLVFAGAAGIMTFFFGVLPFALREGPFWIFRHYGATLTSYPYASVNAFNLFALWGGNFAPDTDRWILFSYRTSGFIFIVLLTLLVISLFLRSADRSAIFCLAGCLVAAVFILGCRMHERYLFPALIFLLVAYLFRPNVRLLLIYVGLSFTHFLNVGYVLIASLAGVYQIPRHDPLLLSVSACNILLLVFLLITASSMSREAIAAPIGSGPPLQNSSSA